MAENTTVRDIIRELQGLGDNALDRDTLWLCMHVLHRAHAGDDDASIMGWVAYRKRIGERLHKDAARRVLKALKTDRWSICAHVRYMRLEGEEEREAGRRRRVADDDARAAWHMQQAGVQALIPDDKRGNNSKGRARREEKPGEPRPMERDAERRMIDNHNRRMLKIKNGA